MPLFTQKSDLIAYLNQNQSGKTIGFVPTMGALHNGHLSLLQQSLNENDCTVLSIFVNPTQFNNPEDLQKYPRTLQADTTLVQQLDPHILIYAPSVSDIYPQQAVAENFDYDGLENQMEGKHRPGHFNGVGTIVKKLFQIVQPTRAYFGEKDYQQLLIIQKMVQKNHLPVTIVPCPILREPSGLALSSRNQRLSEQGKQQAAHIYQILLQTKTYLSNHTLAQTLQQATQLFQAHPYFTLEYIEIADAQTLQTLTHKQPNSRLFVAVWLENIRLIDNIAL